MTDTTPPYHDDLTEEEKAIHCLFRGRKWAALQGRLYDELANLRPENFLDLDRHLLSDGSEEAARLRVTLWSTVIDMGQKRLATALKTLGQSTDVCLESFYQMPSMPYGQSSNYEVEQDSFAHSILSLPYGDPEYIFEWSKLVKDSHLNTDRKHPRVVIEMEGDRLEVSSDLPVEFFVTGPAIKIPDGVDPDAWVDELNGRVREACDKAMLANPDLRKGEHYVKPLKRCDDYAVCEPFAVSPSDCGVLNP